MAREAGPALAPSTTIETVSMPSGIDDSRFGEKVRWYVDEDMETPPPAWHVLLLEATFRNPSFTVEKVATNVAAVLGMAMDTARLKARHARDHYFAVVSTTPEFNQAVRRAKALQGRGLIVRVTPATQKPPGSEQGSSQGSSADAPAAGGADASLR